MEIIKKLERVILNSINPVFVLGKAGMGKTAVIEMIANKHNMKFYDMRGSMLDSSEIMGIPYHTNKNGVEMMSYALPEWVIDCGKQPSIVLLSEFDRSHISVQNAFLQILNERKINNYKFPNHVKFIADGNGINDMVGIEELSLACRNRFMFYKYDISFDEWYENYGKANVISTLTSFLKDKGDYFYRKAASDDLEYATPRSWTNFSKFIENVYPHPNKEQLLELCNDYGYGYVGSSITALINYINETCKIDVSMILKDEYDRTQLRRDKISELLYEIRRMDIRDFDPFQIYNINKFLNTIDVDERMSFMFSLINENDKRYFTRDVNNKLIAHNNIQTMIDKFYDEIVTYRDKKVS